MAIESEELFTIYRMGDGFLARTATEPPEYFSVAGRDTLDAISESIRQLVIKGLEKKK